MSIFDIGRKRSPAEIEFEKLAAISESREHEARQIREEFLEEQNISAYMKVLEERKSALMLRLKDVVKKNIDLVYSRAMSDRRFTESPQLWARINHLLRRKKLPSLERFEEWYTEKMSEGISPHQFLTSHDLAKERKKLNFKVRIKHPGGVKGNMTMYNILLLWLSKVKMSKFGDSKSKLSRELAFWEMFFPSDERIHEILISLQRLNIQIRRHIRTVYVLLNEEQVALRDMLLGKPESEFFNELCSAVDLKTWYHLLQQEHYFDSEQREDMLRFIGYDLKSLDGAEKTAAKHFLRTVELNGSLMQTVYHWHDIMREEEQVIRDMISASTNAKIKVIHPGLAKVYREDRFMFSEFSAKSGPYMKILAEKADFAKRMQAERKARARQTIKFVREAPSVLERFRNGNWKRAWITVTATFILAVGAHSIQSANHQKNKIGLLPSTINGKWTETVNKHGMPWQHTFGTSIFSDRKLILALNNPLVQTAVADTVQHALQEQQIISDKTICTYSPDYNFSGFEDGEAKQLEAIAKSCKPATTVLEIRIIRGSSSPETTADSNKRKQEIQKNKALSGKRITAKCNALKKSAAAMGFKYVHIDSTTAEAGVAEWSERFDKPALELWKKFSTADPTEEDLEQLRQEIGTLANEGGADSRSKHVRDGVKEWWTRLGDEKRQAFLDDLQSRRFVDLEFILVDQSALAVPSDEDVLPAGFYVPRDIDAIMPKETEVKPPPTTVISPWSSKDSPVHDVVLQTPNRPGGTPWIPGTGDRKKRRLQSKQVWGKSKGQEPFGVKDHFGHEPDYSQSRRRTKHQQSIDRQKLGGRKPRRRP